MGKLTNSKPNGSNSSLARDLATVQVQSKKFNDKAAKKKKEKKELTYAVRTLHALDWRVKTYNYKVKFSHKPNRKK